MKKKQGEKRKYSRLDEGTRSMLGWNPELERIWAKRNFQRDENKYKVMNRKNIAKREEAGEMREGIAEQNWEDLAYSFLEPQEWDYVDIMGDRETKPHPLDIPKVIKKSKYLNNKNHMNEMLRSGRPKYPEASPYEAQPGEMLTEGDRWMEDYLNYGVDNQNRGKQNLRAGGKVLIKRNLKTKRK